MAQQLVAFAALTEDLSFVPSSMWGSSQQPVTPARAKLTNIKIKAKLLLNIKKVKLMLRPLKNEHTESVFPFKGLCASLMV